MTGKKLFSKVLIANRGEIAVRIMRTCRELGIGTVAVYSDADRAALHVQYADEAYHIGGNAASESYLLKERLIDVARRARVQAIHPGYGFLAENAAFSQLCSDNGFVFIGPTPSAIEQMGQKILARAIMEKAGVPVIPGTSEPLPDTPEESIRSARLIGFPLMIKASSGGGGKGMRIVSEEKEFASALRGAQSEARSSFGDATVYLEKYITNPHHIEIQLLADQFGNVIHLFERECSVQRRHQKVIEESPSPFIDQAMREAMGQAACEAARAVSYRNAGTVEFIVDGNRNFYFLEMNTRLQVEHPVTELITGRDLVRLQLLVAAGERLPLRQEDISIRGSAIECRIYAEDPDNNYLPSPGLITCLEVPSGPGIRDDSGVYEGYTIPLYYDPLLSKLCSWAETRELSIARMRRALSEYLVMGVKTNLSLLKKIMDHPAFQSGNYTTSFLNEYSEDFKDSAMNEAERDISLNAAAIMGYLNTSRNGGSQSHTREQQQFDRNTWKDYSRQRFLNSRLA